MKTGISSINLSINDWSTTVSTIRHAIEAAKKQAVELLVLPELTIGTPDAQDLFLRPQSAVFAEQCLNELAPFTTDITLVCGTIFEHEGKLYNAAAVFHDGALTAIVPKRYPECATAEERWFSRWDYQKPAEPHLGATFGPWTASKIPELDNLFICVGSIFDYPEIPEKSLCVEICNRQFSINSYRDDLNSHLKLSQKCHISILRANFLGSDDGTHIYDGGGYILNNGHINALSPRFSFDEFVLTTSEDEPADAFDPTLAAFSAVGSCPNSEQDYVFAELELALCLALNDYLKRANIERLCLALSGGRDSAMIAVIVARLNAIRHKDETPEQIREHMKEFLHCAYLPSAASSSSDTQKAALALAEHFGFNCPVIPIAELADATRKTIEERIGRTLTWEHDDLALQNVQARTRSSVIWMLANAQNALLLSTGNMSEAAVGYTTMDGDSCGCLDPIGNIPKTLVSAWLEWARNFHDIPALDFVFAQPPSAELRPIETKQADEKDLMPYAVLDAYMDWFIARRLSPKEIFTLAKNHLASFYTNDDDIRRDIRRFVTLTTRSQWKRQRFANSFIVMPYDLGPASGLRWPCLQNAFTKALNEI